MIQKVPKGVFCVCLMCRARCYTFMMATMLKKSSMLRWAVVWLFTSLLLTGVLQAIALLLGSSSSIGETVSSQFVFILVFSLPWFLGGEILSTLVRTWKSSSWLQKLGSVILFLPVAFLIFISLVFVGVIDFYFS